MSDAYNPDDPTTWPLEFRVLVQLSTASSEVAIESTHDSAEAAIGACDAAFDEDGRTRDVEEFDPATFSSSRIHRREAQHPEPDAEP